MRWVLGAGTWLKAGRHPLNFDALYTVDSYETHEQTLRYLADSGRPTDCRAASLLTMTCPRLAINWYLPAPLAL